jgi:rhodanese-related sulfurtransferase
VESIDAVLQRAAERAASMSLPYQGALLPTEAFALMQYAPDVVLVDVRTAAEWQFVGMVPNALCLEWRTFPGMQPNGRFLELLTAQVPKSATVLFLCRSGARSDEAARAAQAAGYGAVFNVLEGFEGDKDGASQRGQVNGWRKRGLPWVQS